ncbi:MAG: DUF3794 domain-containing protein, partial [Clostridia bacterium]|nr:DUF3794 domain-containing protein [Clostridia bacterium]
MDMNLMTETLTIEQPLGTCQSQAVVEGDVTLNGGLREEAHVLSAGGMAVVENTEALQDRVTVSGRVVFHVLYTQGDPQRVQSVEATADFTHLCELAGAQPRSSVYADAQVEHVEARVQSGRLALRAILRISARALVQQPVEVLTGVAGGEGAQVRTQQFTMRRTVAQGSTDVLLREEFELPEGLSIHETLCATAYPVLSDVSGGLGHIGLTGQVALEAVHATDAEGHPLTVTRHTLPFEQSVEAAGENGDILQGRVTVKDVAVASQDAGDGSRTLRVEVLLGMNASADRQEAVT